jgi:hypothetical protein
MLYIYSIEGCRFTLFSVYKETCREKNQGKGLNPAVKYLHKTQWRLRAKLGWRDPLGGSPPSGPLIPLSLDQGRPESIGRNQEKNHSTKTSNDRRVMIQRRRKIITQLDDFTLNLSTKR